MMDVCGVFEIFSSVRRYAFQNADAVAFYQLGCFRIFRTLTFLFHLLHLDVRRNRLGLATASQIERSTAAVSPQREIDSSLSAVTLKRQILLEGMLVCRQSPYAPVWSRFGTS